MQGGRAARWRAHKQIARLDHPENFAGHPGPNPIQRAIRTLAPSCAQVDTIAVFDGRASYATIKKWWLFQRAMPQWAKDLLQQKLDAHHRALVAPLQQLPTSPGMGWNKGAVRGLGEWRAKQNLGKREP